MLHKDSFTIAPETFKLIQELQAIPELSEFYLVGGTSLALQLGHRNSVDIDLFSQNEFDNEWVTSVVKKHFQFELIYNFKSTLIGILNDHIKTDFIRHNYPFVKPPITEEGITFLSKEDIAAMKLNAIANSGKRLKDFIDIYFLLEHFSVRDMLDFFATKYPNYNKLIPLRAINYFDEIDPEIDPPKMKKNIPLKEIKKRIEDAVLHSKKTY